MYSSGEEVADATLIDGSACASDTSAISGAIVGRAKIAFLHKGFDKSLVFLNLAITVVDNNREIIN